MSLKRGWPIILVLFLMQAAICPADVSWMEHADTCASFSRGLQQYFAELGDLDKLGKQQKGELSLVLEQACGPRFESCGFAVCREEKAAGEIAAVKDPLDWLNRYMTCEQFTQEIRKRYSAVGKLRQATTGEKAELDYVLQVACSPRFGHCRFKNCTAAAAPSSVPGGLDSRPAGTAEPAVSRASAQPSVSPPPGPVPSVSSSAPPLPSPSASVQPSASASPSPAASPSAAPSAAPSRGPSASATPAPSPSPAASPASSPTPSPSATLSPGPSASASPSSSSTPAPSVSPSAAASPRAASKSPEPLPSVRPAASEGEQTIPGQRSFDPVLSPDDSEAAEAQFQAEYKEYRKRQRDIIAAAVAREKKSRASWERLGNPEEKRPENETAPEPKGRSDTYYSGPNTVYQPQPGPAPQYTQPRQPPRAPVPNRVQQPGAGPWGGSLPSGNSGTSGNSGPSGRRQTGSGNPPPKRSF